MQKAKRKTYNDGVLFICEQQSAKSDFGAVRNQISLSDLMTLVKLSYCEMTKRDADITFAESIGRQLSLKVKTLLHSAADAARSVLIGDMLYSIVKLDFDRKRNEMYLYLEEFRRLS